MGKRSQGYLQKHDGPPIYKAGLEPKTGRQGKQAAGGAWNQKAWSNCRGPSGSSRLGSLQEPLSALLDLCEHLPTAKLQREVASEERKAGSEDGTILLIRVQGRGAEPFGRTVQGAHVTALRGTRSGQERNLQGRLGFGHTTVGRLEEVPLIPVHRCGSRSEGDLHKAAAHTTISSHKKISP